MERKQGVVEVNFQYALPFNEGDEIVELGGGERPLRIDGLKTVNVDLRALPQVDIVRDLDKGFGDIGQYDGIFANYLLEHISWRNVERFLSDCFKILKPNTYAVFVVPDTYAQAQKVLQSPPEEIDFGASNFLFGGQDHEGNFHKWFISRPFLEALLIRAGFEKVVFHTHPDPNARDMYVEAYKGVVTPSGLTKLNLGSFTVTFGYNWVNCDIRGDIKPVVEAKGHLFEYCDVTKPLRWGDNTVDLITAHHLIEHLSRGEGGFMLKECYRVLKPNGVIRLSTPDLDTFMLHHSAKNFKETYANEYEVQNSEDDVDALFRLAFMGHKTIYNYQSLATKMANLGFIDIKKMGYNQSRSDVIRRETEDSFPDHSFYIEATKTDIVVPPKVLKPDKAPSITVREDIELYQKYLRGELEEGTQ